MATTDTKAGFRLPWTSDKSDTAAPTDAAPEAVVDAPAVEPEATPQETETTAMIDAAPAAPDHEAAVETEAAAPTPPPVTPAPSAGAPARKPNKFMADLTRAMQSAAESAREETLARLAAEQKTYIEEIHAASATEATQLRQKADDDVASIREWSKAEIARIREETDERISHRKGTLEHEIEEHAAFIEARIERVQARVTAFENEMAAFFERLLAEEDPTRFAALAESLPEPPPLDGHTVAAWTPPATDDVPEAPTVEFAEVADPVADVAPAAAVEGETQPFAEFASATEPETVVAPEPAPLEGDGQAAADDPFGLMGGGTDGAAAHDVDPRLAMLGLPADFAAAEAEAATFDTSDDGSDEPGPALADEDISARLAGLVSDTADGTTAESVTTRVVVTGLVSVASIAGFKRHLSRAVGVQSVGVSSGPDGEFVFAVGHGADVSLRDAITTLPGFGARVTAEGEGELTVAAHDPEAGA